MIPALVGPALAGPPPPPPWPAQIAVRYHHIRDIFQIPSGNPHVPHAVCIVEHVIETRTNTTQWVATPYLHSQNVYNVPIDDQSPTAVGSYLGFPHRRSGTGGTASLG